jgi:O-antigen/teichoic acid export membrane protein
MTNVGAVFEAIVMGAQRIDLVRKFGTVLTVAEAGAIVAVLELGYSLGAMAAVMGGSELLYILLCYFASRRLIPEVQVSWRAVNWSACPELIRYAGSYQLLNFLEVVYISVVPFAVLHAYGAGAAGVYALAARVINLAGIIHEAFLPPLLSAGASVFASGAPERMRDLIISAFRTTLALSVVPLGLAAAFGAIFIYAWTGQTDPSMSIVIPLICLSAGFKSLTRLGSIFYRTSGNVVYDNVSQLLRVVLMVGIASVAKALGFPMVLFGMAMIEAVGLAVLAAALVRTFPLVPVERLAADLGRCALATVLIVAAGAVALFAPLSQGMSGRSAALLQLVQVSVGCLFAAYPIAAWTGVITRAERAAVLQRASGTWFEWRRAKAR